MTQMQPIYQVDAFADRPFAGNPAAVCPLTTPQSDAWMQNVAAEMNLAETAFLLPQAEGGYNLRWFTPAIEVDLCGHATLASAHILWETGILPPTEAARFQTRSGLLTCRKAGETITMDFPAEAPHPAEPPAGMIEALNVTPLWTGRNRFDSVIQVETERIVRELTPDFSALAASFAAQGVEWYRGVIVTAQSQDGAFDFVSRCFYPPAGVMEDPVTGSAHCALAPFWAERLGKSALIGYQASARGGIVAASVSGDRVLLGGQAVTVLRGELRA